MILSLRKVFLELHQRMSRLQSSADAQHASACVWFQRQPKGASTQAGFSVVCFWEATQGKLTLPSAVSMTEQSTWQCREETPIGVATCCTSCTNMPTPNYCFYPDALICVDIVVTVASACACVRWNAAIHTCIHPCMHVLDRFQCIHSCMHACMYGNRPVHACMRACMHMTMTISIDRTI